MNDLWYLEYEASAATPEIGDWEPAGCVVVGGVGVIAVTWRVHTFPKACKLFTRIISFENENLYMVYLLSPLTTARLPPIRWYFLKYLVSF